MKSDCNALTSKPDLAPASPVSTTEVAQPSGIARRAVIDGAMAGVAGLAGLAAIGAFAGRAKAGPLEPPEGPITPTGFTTEDLWGRVAAAQRALRPSTPIGPDTTPSDFPNRLYTISQPGRYHLAENISVPAGIDVAIAIVGDALARGVSIDLNGCVLSTVNGTAFGVLAIGAGLAVRIHNGVIIGFSVGAELTDVRSAVVEDLIVDSAATGVVVGQAARVTACTISNCNTSGLIAGSGSVVSGCSFSNAKNALDVIGSAVDGCAIRGARDGRALRLREGSVACRCSVDATGAAPTSVTPVVIEGTSRLERTSVRASCRSTVLSATGSCVVDACSIENLEPDTSGGLVQLRIVDYSLIVGTIIKRPFDGGGITMGLSTGSVMRDCIISGNGLPTSFIDASAQGTIAHTNNSLGSGNFVGSEFQEPIYVTGAAVMPTDFSRYGNIVRRP